MLTEYRWGGAVSNTRAYKSLLDVPPPPGCLITIVKGLGQYHTNNTTSPTYRTAFPHTKVHLTRAGDMHWQDGGMEWLFNVFQSSCIVGIQVHLLLPPPLVGYQSLLPLLIHAVTEDAVLYHIHSDRVPPLLNIFHNRAQLALLQYILQLGTWDRSTFDPGHAEAHGVLPSCMPLGYGNLQSCQHQLADHPCLAAVEQ